MNLLEHLKYALLDADDSRILNALKGQDFPLLLHGDSYDDEIIKALKEEAKKRGLKI